eukprot:1428785-Pleurochrysis_carterae.AAC.2
MPQAAHRPFANDAIALVLRALHLNEALAGEQKAMATKARGVTGVKGVDAEGRRAADGLLVRDA